jgi:uncharacterized SAM-binding protein YcdF (DUF218 family)
MTHGRLWLAAVPLCLAAGFWFFSGPILRGLGSLLVNDGPPAKCDMIVVLAGDMRGGRILKGAELAREGFAPAVLVSNGGFNFSHSESELAIEFAIQHGYSPDLLIRGDWNASSTTEEAEQLLRALRKMKAHKILMVTSLWHTARARRIYRRLAPDMEFNMVGSTDPNWHNGDWWVEREGRKTFFLEVTKTIADFLRI